MVPEVDSKWPPQLTTVGVDVVVVVVLDVVGDGVGSSGTLNNVF